MTKSIYLSVIKTNYKPQKYRHIPNLIEILSNIVTINLNLLSNTLIVLGNHNLQD